MSNKKLSWIVRSYAWFRNQDLLVLLLMLGVVLGVWAFFELADGVKEGATRQMDEAVLKWFRSPADLADPVGPRWFEDSVRDITALGGSTVLSLVVLAIAGFVLLQRQFHAFWLMLAAIGGGVLLNVLIKGWFGRPRPELVPHLSHVSSASFPSGHSMLSAVVYFTLAALLTRLVAPLRIRIYILFVALTFSLLVGLSRIYLGVHYPTDVLAGWTLGLLWAILCWLTARFLQKRGAVETAPGASNL
jgi:undecaprenyl-diphosphatase